MYNSNMLFWMCIAALVIVALLIVYDAIATCRKARKLRKAKDRPLADGKSWGQKRGVPYGVREDCAGSAAGDIAAAKEKIGSDMCPSLPMWRPQASCYGETTYPKIEIDQFESHEWRAITLRATTWKDGRRYAAETMVDLREAERWPNALKLAEERLKDMLHAYLGKGEFLLDRQVETRSVVVSCGGLEHERRTVTTVETYMVPLNRKRA